ncbi:exocyst complex component 3-like protein 2 [Periophthalmus magnuspinnatus]|uniref:exocyst complex component 3-like protein 2 n=1 Tax=Periophthalmus magnuspinnatus TaxID=409849 RepID=UPI002436D9C5|nr:exocyst complex component 3-like protein 2 [Periophthalmus magnuspinnatus]
MREQISGLWTAQWLDGSLPLVDSLLDFLDQKLELLTDLKPSCTQWVLGRLHRDVALRYFKNLLKTKRRNQKEQVGGANRMKDDVTKMDAFFTQQGSGSQWVSQLLLQVAEVLRLQDPDSVQLELLSLIQLCPDLRYRTGSTVAV